MTVLVLGGSGFIGSHLVDGLLAAGHRVRVFDRSPELFRAPLAGVDYRFGDFSDVPLLAEALEGVDLVYHLLSTTVPSTSNLDPIADVNGNLVNSLRLLQLMVQKNIPKIIYLSSGGTVYGIPECVPIPETHPLRPICSYGVVKVAIENYLHMFHELHGLQYVVLRASNPYGERQGHAGVQGVIGTFMQKILAGDQIEIWGDGRVVRDYIYVGDLAELCVIAGRPEKVGVFNAGSGEGTSINELINKLTSVTGMNLTYVNRTGRGYDVPRVVLDIGSTVSNFGWLPSTTLDHGLITTWNWFLEGA